MGRLRDARGVAVELVARSIVGRVPPAQILLEHPAVSREHAVLEWGAGCWRIRDLGSRNGTRVGGRACTTAFEELTEGDVLTFGDHAEPWVLEDASPPPPAAIGPDRRTLIGTGDLLLLPDDDAPVASVERRGDVWVVEDSAETRLVTNGQSVDVGGVPWILLLPAGSGGITTRTAPQPLRLDDLTAVVKVEHVDLIHVSFEHANGRVDLPSRAHDEVLLALARARVEHQRAGFPPPHEGWVDSLSLSEQLGVSPEKLNTDIFRARRLLAEQGIVDAARIVERAPRTRELRFGIGAIRLMTE